MIAPQCRCLVMGRSEVHSPSYGSSEDRARRRQGKRGPRSLGEYPSPLEDDSAVLSAMTYVDLNPIRAGMADDLPGSNHTSAQLRSKRISQNKQVASFGLKPVAGLCERQLLDMTEATYLSLVDWSGRLLHTGKIGKIDDDAPPILAALGLTERRWAGQVRGTESIYWRAIGSVDSLLDLTEELGQQWLRGIRAVMALERPG